MPDTAQPHHRPSRVAQVALAVVVCAAAAILRTSDISRHFWLLGDRIRDWKIALALRRSAARGPSAHVGGYTIGPAFYWLLWLIRVVVGPWFENLPHAGGIGQAWLQSGADALLLGAIWKRTGSVWIALAAVAWCAVHCYTGTIFVALSVFAALVAAPIVRREWQTVFRRALVVWIVVVALQIPYVVHRVWIDPAGPPGMGVVAESLAGVASGGAIRLRASVMAYAHALNGIQLRPQTSAATAWLALACGLIVAARHPDARRARADNRGALPASYRRCSARLLGAWRPARRAISLGRDDRTERSGQLPAGRFEVKGASQPSC